ncbi:MAG: hypothetical protein Q8S32_12215 [Burkholderiaceae bacterium]|nr:hypothetical protein [Burkholderiaceae bacterium]MDP3424513.1 hypothetical protein [Burkholderiaceae bacterium]
MDLRKITRKQFINYGGDAIAAMTAGAALIGLITSQLPPEEAASLGIVSLFLTRGSTILANLIDSLENNEETA